MTRLGSRLVIVGLCALGPTAAPGSSNELPYDRFDTHVGQSFRSASAIGRGSSNELPDDAKELPYDSNELPDDRFDTHVGQSFSSASATRPGSSKELPYDAKELPYDSNELPDDRFDTHVGQSFSSAAAIGRGRSNELPYDSNELPDDRFDTHVGQSFSSAAATRPGSSKELPYDAKELPYDAKELPDDRFDTHVGQSFSSASAAAPGSSKELPYDSKELPDDRFDTRVGQSFSSAAATRPGSSKELPYDAKELPYDSNELPDDRFDTHVGQSFSSAAATAPGSSKELPYDAKELPYDSNELPDDRSDTHVGQSFSSAAAIGQPAGPREFSCGTERVTVAIEGTTLRLTAAGATYVLQQVPVASGARFETVDDPSTWFWNRGQVASLRIRGRGYPECIASTATPSADAGTFRALGHEPGWRLDIVAGQLTLVTDYGQTKVSVPTPFAEAFAGGRRYIASSAGRPITATILDQPCADAATGLPRPFTVRVEFAGQTLRGCGGETQDLLRGDPWVVETIGGAPLAPGTRATLQFGDDGHLSGSASCNSYAASYAVTGETFTVGPAVATRKACAPAVMAQETAFLAALGAAHRLEMTADGTLVLHTANGQRITSKRE